MAKKKTAPPAPPAPINPWNPLPFHGLRCHCGEGHYQSGRYYVTVRRDDGDSRALAGPFAEHDEALAWVSRATDAAHKRDTRAAWYSFGTAVLKYGYDKPGILNADLGLAA
jgi:hypothetical protein